MHKEAKNILESKTIFGFFWMASQAFLTKATGTIGQLCLAWLLTRSDLGRVGLALTIAQFASILQQAGLREILVQRHLNFARWVNSAFWLSVCLGIASAAIMLALIPAAVQFYHEPQLKVMIAILSISSVAASMGAVPQAALEITLRFKYIAAVNAIQGIIQVGVSIILAWLKFGAVSVVVAQALAMFFKTAAFLIAAKLPVAPRLQFKRWRFLGGDASNLLVAYFFLNIVWQGDYAILGHTKGTATVGIYYFAFNLSTQTIVLLASSLWTVLFPTLSKMTNDPPRQLQAFLRAGRMLAMIGIPLCFLQDVLARPGILLFFSQKWALSIPVLQILSVGMAIRIVEWPSEILIKARGRFRTFLIMSIANAAVFVPLVYISATRGGAVTVAISVTGLLICFGFTRLYIAIQPLGGGLRQLWTMMGPSLVSAIAASLLAFGVSSKMDSRTDRHYLILQLFTVLLTFMFYIPFLFLLDSKALHDCKLLAARFTDRIWFLRRVPIAGAR